MGALNWTAAQEETLRLMAARGCDVEEIGAVIGRTEVAVIVRMKFLSIPRPGKRKTWRKWSADEIATLTRLHGDGVPLREIARRLDRGHSAVANRARKIGLCRYRPPPDDDESDLQVGGIDLAHESAETAAPTRRGRTFSEIETRRVRRFLARGDTLADVARQMRCDIDDIKAIPGIASELPQGEGCGGAGARRQPKTTTTTNTAPRHEPSPPPG